MRIARSLLACAGISLVRCAASEAAPPTPAAEPGVKPAERAPASTAPRVVTAKAEPSGACPPEMALIDRRFCIDRWEAITLDDAGEVHSPYQAVTFNHVRADSRPGYVPQAYISMEEADLACERAGKRLCTTGQWVDACRGTGRVRRTYPYGNIEDPSACNVRGPGPSPLFALHGGQRPTDSWNMNDPAINQLASTVAPTGVFRACVTPQGVEDMVGNLLEWTRGERPLLMGGHYLDAKVNGEGCSYVTSRHDAKYHDYTTGFRCCREPNEPETTVAAALSPKRDVAAATKPKESTSEARDPAGFRSFSRPAAPLPPMPEPPPYASGSDACPADMVLVSGEHCNAPEQECLHWLEVPGQEPMRSCEKFAPSRCQGGTRAMRYCIDPYEYTPKGWKLPLVHVSWTEAQNICHAEDKRLCAEDEWEFACEGAEALPYPYGTERDGKACNHDLPDLFDRRGKLYDRRVPADSLPRCKSPFGVFNMVGNVDEWTTRAGNERPWRSILRGGWWLTGRNRCRAATESHNEVYAGPQTGFRCCKAARP